MNVVFENSAGEKRVITKNVDMDIAMRTINVFLIDHNYKAPYYRYMQSGSDIQIDVGSHTEFFYLTDCRIKDINQYFKERGNE